MTGLPRNWRVASAVFGGLAAIALGLTPTLAGHLGTGQTSTANLNVTANVPAQCSFTTGPLSFGDYTGTALAATTSTDVNCNQGAVWEVEYDPGLWSVNNDCFTRRMATTDMLIPLDFLTYTIDDGSPVSPTLLGRVGELGCTTHTGTGTGSAQSNPVDGLIGGGQSPRASGYADRVTVTLHF